MILGPHGREHAAAQPEEDGKGGEPRLIQPRPARDEPLTVLTLLQSIAGGLLCILHGVLNGLLALDLPEWPMLIYAFIAIGPHTHRFERVGHAVEGVLDRLERLVKTTRGSGPRDHGPKL